MYLYVHECLRVHGCAYTDVLSTGSRTGIQWWTRIEWYLPSQFHFQWIWDTVVNKNRMVSTFTVSFPVEMLSRDWLFDFLKSRIDYSQPSVHAFHISRFNQSWIKNIWKHHCIHTKHIIPLRVIIAIPPYQWQIGSRTPSRNQNPQMLKSFLSNDVIFAYNPCTSFHILETISR
jgi:hypothetical protein